jgi:hypothetical protein
MADNPNGELSRTSDQLREAALRLRDNARDLLEAMTVLREATFALRDAALLLHTNLNVLIDNDKTGSTLGAPPTDAAPLQELEVLERLVRDTPARQRQTSPEERQWIAMLEDFEPEFGAPIQ